MIKLSVLSVVLSLSIASQLQAQVNQRTQFNQGLTMFTELVMKHELGEAIDLIQVNTILEKGEIARLNAELRNLVAEDFVDHQTVRSEVLKNGFRQELLAFWTEENAYFYVYIFLHSRKDGYAVLDIRHSTEVQELMTLF